MVEHVRFILVLENGGTRSFKSMVEAMEYANSTARAWPRPKKLIRRSVQVRNEVMREW